MRWTDREVRNALGLSGPGDDLPFRSIDTDTRTLGPGSLFVALVGERFDGHGFLAEARAAGASGAVVRAGTPAVDGLRLYEVADTLGGYGLLARHRRRAMRGPVIAITGTNGKTSTKEMMAAALGTRHRTHTTRRNLNNLVGVPLTILEAPADTEALVVEAGANQLGEIAKCRAIIEPTATVITNVAAGHLEGFGSVAGVLGEKLELARGVALAVVGPDPPALARGARRLAGRVVTAGLADADVVPNALGMAPGGHPVITIDGLTFRLGLKGRHQAANAMLVWAMARALELDRARVARALETCSIPGGRGELIERGGLTILNDSYNANPASFRAAIDLARVLRGTDGRRLIFVAGSMRELGPEAAVRHREVAEWLLELAPDVLAVVGEFVEALGPERKSLGERLLVAEDAEALAPLLTPRIEGTELIVLKGSRGEALERLLPVLTATTDTPA